MNLGFLIIILFCISFGMVIGIYFAVTREKKKQEIIGHNLTKFKQYFIMLCDWIDKNFENKMINSFLKENEISTIAIYGMGKLGMLLVKEFNINGIDILYAIDRNRNACSDVTFPILSPDDILPDVDLIIITPINDFEDIEDSLIGKTKADIISLDDLIMNFN